MNKKIFLLIAVLQISICSFAQVTVGQYMNDNKDVVVYFLPKQSFVVEVIYSEKQNIPGPYSKYAQNLLGIDNAIMAKNTSFHIEGIKLHPFVEPDASAKFTLKAPEPGKVEKDTYLILNDLGVFCGLTTNKEVDGNFSSINYGNMMNSIEMPSFNNFSAVPSQFTVVDTLIRVVSFDTSFYKMETYNSKVNNMSLDKKAEEAVKKLMDIRNSRMDLLTGYQETAYDANAIKYMDNRLLEVENAYLSLFSGYTNVKYYKYCFVYSPDVSHANKETNILCFTQEAGVCTSNKQGAGQQLSVQITSHSDVLKIQAPDDSKGIRYRVPVLADVIVKYEGKVLTGGVFSMPQFGNTISLDLQKYKQITVDPTTGNIKSVKVE